MLSALAPCFLMGICWNRKCRPLALDEILEGYYARQGGIDHLSTITSMRVVGVNHTPDNEPAEFHLYKKATNRSYLVINTKSPTEQVVMAFNGEYPWMKEGFEAPELMPEVSAQIFVRDAPILSHLAHSYKRGIRLALVGETMIRKEYCYQINATLPDGAVIEYYIGRDDFLEKKIAHEMTVDGQLERHEAYLSQYGVVGKLLQPFLIETFVNNGSHSAIEVREMQINVPIADDLFEPEVSLAGPVKSGR